MHSFKPNDVFAGRYVLLELIGKGGFSEVWKAEDYMTDRTIVAIKIYAPESGLDGLGIQHFKKEYAITQDLFHPHLVKVNHFDITEGSPYLVMPFFEKGSLGVLLHRKESFTEVEIARILMQLGGALAYLHKQTPPVLHQDIKPDNILISSNGDFLLTDFGISSRTRSTLRKATGNTASMTVAYSPPERFMARPAYNESGDIFSMGVMFYELCTRELPWMGYGGQSLLQGAQLPDLPKPYSKKINEIVKSCMAMDCKSRPSAQELEKTGKIFLEKNKWEVNFKEKNNTDSKSPGKKEKFIKSYKSIFFVSAAALLGLLIVIYFLNTNTYDNQPTKDAYQADLKPDMDVSVITPGNTTMVNKEQDDNSDEINNKPKTIDLPLESGLSYVKPHTLAEYLNQISNHQIPIKVRKQWKEDIVAYFESKDVMVYDESEEIIFNKYTIESLIDFLLTSRNTKLTVIGEERNSNNKITRLSVEITSNTSFP